MPEKHIIVNGEIKEILTKLAKIEQRLEDIGVPQCGANSQRLKSLEKRAEKVEEAVGNNGKITLLISSLTTAVVLTVKHLAGK